MDYRADMERCLAFARAQSGEALSAQTLAQHCGYSYFHFCHVFKSIYGVSAGAYLRQMRLFDAAQRLRDGCSVTETAFACGFESVSGFARAFRRRFGAAPSDFQKQQGGILMIVPKLETKDAFFAAGYVLPAEEELDPQSSGAYWLGKDFSAVSAEDYAKLCAPGYAEIGTWLLPEDESDKLCYFLGPEVAEDAALPARMRLLAFPAATYAVFPVPKGETPQQLHENVSAVWRFIFKDWFAQSGYVFDVSARDFERYCGEETDIYVPVKPGESA